MSELPPGTVWSEHGEWYCDPYLVAPHLGLSAQALRAGLRNGTVTGTVERGEGDDAGRTRLTYRYRERAWSVCVEPDGRIIETAPPVSQGAALDWLLGRRPHLLWRGGPPGTEADSETDGPSRDGSA